MWTLITPEGRLDVRRLEVEDEQAGARFANDLFDPQRIAVTGNVNESTGPVAGGVAGAVCELPLHVGGHVGSLKHVGSLTVTSAQKATLSSTSSGC